VTVRENAIGVVYRPRDADPNSDTVTYGATIGGPDAARFTMNALTREIRFVAQPNFEAPADVGANNVYDISFTASDGATTVTPECRHHGQQHRRRLPRAPRRFRHERAHLCGRPA
jgi:hypothetical protein